MQQSNPLSTILPHNWQTLGSDHDIRVSRQHHRVESAARGAFASKTHFNHAQSMEILARIATLLDLDPHQPHADSAIEQKAREIQAAILQILQANPQQHLNPADVARVRDDVTQMVPFLRQRQEEFLQRRLHSHAVQQEALSSSAPAAPIALQQQIQLSEDWKKKFIKVHQALEALAARRTEFENYERQQAQILSGSFGGYNALDPENRATGDYPAFMQALKSKIDPKDTEVRQLEQKTQKRLVKFMNWALGQVQNPADCKLLLERLERSRVEFQVNQSLFGKLLCSQLHEEKYATLLRYACLEDLEHTNLHTEIFRSTESMRGGIIGAFLTRLADQQINPVIIQLLNSLEQSPLTEERMVPCLKDFLDSAQTNFCKTQFTSAQLLLLNDVRRKIFQKWHRSGNRILIGALFLRGSTKLIIDRALRSHNKMALIKLGKAFQTEANQFTAPQFLAMEKHLLHTLQHHFKTEDLQGE